MSAPRRAPRRLVDGVLLFDKPAGPSSNQALQTVRRLFNAEKAGHTGTLDPFATGLLPICFGEATKFSADLLDADKRYLATAQLGAETDSGDSSGVVVRRHERPVDVARDEVESVLGRFRGEIEQVPPMHSALKRDGTPLYELARKGIEVERMPRRIRVMTLALVAFENSAMTFSVHCSKGTYVRTLAQDIGRALGCGAHLTALRRTAIGSFDIEEAISLTQIEGIELPERDRHLKSVDCLVATLPVVALDADASRRLGQGQAIAYAGMDGSRVRLQDPNGRFLGVGRSQGDWIKPERLIADRGAIC